MRLEKPSSATLIAWILIATIMLAIFVALIATRAGSVAILYGIVIIPLSVLSIATAWMLDDSPDPVLQIDDHGLTLSPIFSTGAHIPWADIERIRLVSIRYGLLMVPVASHLIIQLRDNSHISGLQWLSPASWLGRIMIPARFVRGGRGAMLKAVQATRTGLLQGEIDRDARLSGTDDRLRSGDAAIARAVAARGGLSSFQAQPRSLDDLAYGSDAPAVPKADDPIPPRVSDTVMPMRPASPPAPIMVNGVPYQLQRQGGFGRKRA